jgi:ubiquinol oxidase
MCHSHSHEDWNELHHLLIMESLGGNAVWSDRFIGYHAALAYYWFLIVVYLCSPRIAYQFMELLESHAVDTYGTFVKVNRQRLSELPAPTVARSYYLTGDLYLFDDFQVSRSPGTRRPPCDTLLDVFENICMDEAEHVKTMKACQDYASFGTKVVSPHLNYKQSGKADEERKRALWKQWSEVINEGFQNEMNP